MRAVMSFSLVVVAFAAACGFDCQVQGETQHFNDCEALQDAYDALGADDAAERDDIDTCGELVGCEIQP
jgi:hypothetical protein